MTSPSTPARKPDRHQGFELLTRPAINVGVHRVQRNHDGPPLWRAGVFRAPARSSPRPRTPLVVARAQPNVLTGFDLPNVTPPPTAPSFVGWFLHHGRPAQHLQRHVGPPRTTARADGPGRQHRLLSSPPNSETPALGRPPTRAVANYARPGSPPCRRQQGLMGAGVRGRMDRKDGVARTDAIASMSPPATGGAWNDSPAPRAWVEARPKRHSVWLSFRRLVGRRPYRE